MDLALLLLWYTFSPPPFFPGGPLVGAKHITETQIFTGLVGKRVEKTALWFVHDEPEYVRFLPTPSPPTLFSILSFPNLVLEYETSKLSEAIKGHLVWWSPNCSSFSPGEHFKSHILGNVPQALLDW